jgi:hypothetical protein
VARGKYESLEEGIAVNVKVYVAAMERIQRAKKFELFIHPIVPVLDATRATVKAFNKVRQPMR